MFLSYIGECVEHPRNIGEFTGFLPGPEVVIGFWGTACKDPKCPFTQTVYTLFPKVFLRTKYLKVRGIYFLLGTWTLREIITWGLKKMSIAVYFGP